MVHLAKNLRDMGKSSNVKIEIIVRRWTKRLCVSVIKIWLCDIREESIA